MQESYETLCYCVNLRRGAGILSGLYDRALAEAGVNGAQFYLLVALDALGQANITRWAEFVGLDRTTMVRNGKLLMERGWIVEQEQGRGKQLALSPLGKEVLERGTSLWERTQSRIEDYLGKEDTEALLRISKKLKQIEKEKIQ